MSGRRTADASGRFEAVVAGLWAMVARLSAIVTRLSAASPIPTRTLAGLLGLLPVSGMTAYRIAHNSPVALPAGVTELAPVVLPTLVVGPALAGLLLAATADAPGERVGLAFVGGFGLLALASPSAWLPAAVSTIFGGSLLAGSQIRRFGSFGRSGRSGRSGRFGRGESVAAVRRAVVPVVLVAGVVASLTATAGVAPATLRPVGSGLALVGIGLTPMLVGADRTSLIFGALGGILAVGLATSAPYVAGAVLLVGGGVVGVPLGLVAFAVGGAVVALSYALRRGRTDATFGVGLLLVAGVPGTLPRAVGVVVALALVGSVRSVGSFDSVDSPGSPGGEEL